MPTKKIRIQSKVHANVEYVVARVDTEFTQVTAMQVNGDGTEERINDGCVELRGGVLRSELQMWGQTYDVFKVEHALIPIWLEQIGIIKAERARFCTCDDMGKDMTESAVTIQACKAKPGSHHGALCPLFSTRNQG